MTQNVSFEEELDFDELEMSEPSQESVEITATSGEGELYEHYRVVADKGQQLLRVDKFLINLMHDTSRNRSRMHPRQWSCRQEQLPRQTQ